MDHGVAPSVHALSVLFVGCLSRRKGPSSGHSSSVIKRNDLSQIVIFVVMAKAQNALSVQP
jgi:hypothetical protein